ncbi:MAG: carboxy terminal-processing peptidase [Verrucomicrobiota bacterium]
MNTLAARESSKASAKVEVTEEEKFDLLDLPKRDVPLSEIREKSEESYFPRNLEELMSQQDEEKEAVDYTMIAKRAVALLEGNHVLKHKVDDQFSARFLETFLGVLDPTKEFFTQSDIERFESRYADSLDDKMKAGEIKPAYEIFEIYEKSVAEILEDVEEILWDEAFPFGAGESRVWDREDEARPKNKAERTQLWRDLIAADLLKELIREGDQITANELAEAKLELLSGYRRLYTTSQQYAAEHIAYRFLKAFALAFDSHSVFYSPVEIANNRIASQNSLIGIGATLQMNKKGHVEITSLVPGGPAAMSGKLKSGDKIVGVGEGPGGEMFRTRNQRLSATVDRIRGELGTRVRLEIISTDGRGEEKKLTILLERGKVEFRQSLARAELYAVPSPSGTDNYVGWIDVPKVYGDGNPENPPSVSQDIQRLIERLKEERVDAIILNLSENSGGDLREISAIGGLFIGSRAVSVNRGSEGNLEVQKAEVEAPIWEGPLVVQTSRVTAAGGEILASAFQDYGRAMIVGESQTFGVGTAGRLYAVAEDGSEALGYFRITTDMNFRVSGQSNQLVGVTPDIIIPSTRDTMEYGTEFLDNPIPSQAIPPTEFEAWSELSLPMGELRLNSISRVLQDVELRQIAQNNLAEQEREERNKTSLDVGVRVSQRDESREGSQAVEAELRSYFDSIRNDYEEEMRAWNIPISRIDDRRLQNLADAAPEDLTGVTGISESEIEGPVRPLGFDAAKREAIAIAMDLIELEDRGD